MTSNQAILIFLAGVAALIGSGYYLGQRKAVNSVEQGVRFHSTPDYYGWFTAICMFLPALFLTVGIGLVQYFQLMSVPNAITIGLWFAIPAVMFPIAYRVVTPTLRARNIVEGVVYATLLSASLVSILTTVGIVLTIVFEAMRFFNQVNLFTFLTGTTWAPDTAFLGGAGRGEEVVSEPKFGAVPLFAGTFMITLIAMSVAVPVGILSAVYLSEFASKPVRKIAKPMIEILAGIPTVVYGFFAAITVSPMVVTIAASLGLEADYTNALSPGLIMGIMIIPFMSSLSDDVISAVPQEIRRAAFAVGATRAEVIKGIVLPAALPGIVSAFLLAVSRAIGETMIVVMAAGLQPNVTGNPLEGMTTITVRIVDALVGDQEFDSLETLSAFGLGLALLVFTLVLNIVSAVAIRRFRLRYE